MGCCAHSERHAAHLTLEHTDTFLGETSVRLPAVLIPDYSSEKFPFLNFQKEDILLM